MTYKDLFDKSKNEPEEFWENQSQNIGWFKPPKTILSRDKYDNTQWFENGELNLIV